MCSSLNLYYFNVKTFWGYFNGPILYCANISWSFKEQSFWDSFHNKFVHLFSKELITPDRFLGNWANFTYREIKRNWRVFKTTDSQLFGIMNPGPCLISSWTAASSYHSPGALLFTGHFLNTCCPGLREARGQPRPPLQQMLNKRWSNERMLWSSRDNS